MAHTNRYIKSIELVKNGRTYGIVINGKLVEGGFFSRDSAVTAHLWWERNYRDETLTSEENAN